MVAMKKIKCLFFVGFLGLILVGCQSAKEKEKTKQTSNNVTQIDEKDKRLMVAQSQLDELEAFEYRLPKDAKELNLWLDIYEGGAKVESERVFIEYSPAKEGIVSFGTLFSDVALSEKDSVEMDFIVRIVSMNSKKGYGKTTEYLEPTQRFAQVNPDIELDEQGTFPLYFEHYFYNESNEYTSLPMEFLYKPEKYLAQMAEGEKVYVYRLEFKQRKKVGTKIICSNLFD